jgi:hypothetical protein
MEQLKVLMNGKKIKKKNLYKKSIHCFNENFQVENVVNKMIKILNEK